MNNITNMNKGLIPLKHDGEAEPTVNARDLHAFLESKQEFSNWIKNRIEQYGFIEGKDFLTILSKTSGGRPSKEYDLTLDMAKELAMVERTEKGKQARLYFIECENELKANKTFDPAAVTKMDALKWALESEEQRLQLQEENKQLASKADAYERLTFSDDTYCLRDAAKVLDVKEKDFLLWLKRHNWIYDRPNGLRNAAYSERVKQGVIIVKTNHFTTSDGREKMTYQTRITAKGMARLSELMAQNVA